MSVSGTRVPHRASVDFTPEETDLDSPVVASLLDLL